MASQHEPRTAPVRSRTRRDLPGSPLASEPLSVVIAGGGFAALEAALALRALAGRKCRLTFIAPDPILYYRPAATTEPFDAAPPRVYDLRAIAAQLGATIRPGRLQAVAPAARELRLSSGVRLSYDVLVLAIGSRAVASVAGATIFRDQRDVASLRRLVADVDAGRIGEVVFAVPSGSSWPLPLYELALLAARRAQRAGVELDISLVSPERDPLEIFGPRASHSVAQVLDEQGVRFIGGLTPLAVRRDGALELAAGGALEADRVISIAQLAAPRIPGIPASWWGFVPTDRCGRVLGRRDVFAAGDMTAFPVKQGGLAAQQADRVAHTIACDLGLPVKEWDPRLVLQAELTGGPAPLLLRTELDWRGRPTAAAGTRARPSGEAGATKVFGRYLAPYLEALEPLSVA